MNKSVRVRRLRRGFGVGVLVRAFSASLSNAIGSELSIPRYLETIDDTRTAIVRCIK